MKKYRLLIFIALLFCVSSHAQSTSWLKGSWNGRAYVIGNPSAKTYNLILSVSKMKGTAFEGTLYTIYRFDTIVTKITGNLTQAYMQINIGPWKVDCGNCKPQSLEYTIESKQFFFKGEAKGCSQECTWIFVFSKSLLEFGEKDQQDLAALAPEVDSEPEDSSLIAQNEIPPPADTIAQKPKEETVIEERKELPPAGDIVLTEKKPGETPKEKTTDLKKNTSVIKQPEIQEKRIAMPAAGSIVPLNKKANYSPQKITGSLQKNFSSIIHPPVIKEKRITMPQGDVIAMNKKQSPYLPKSFNGNLQKSFSFIIQKPVIEEKRIVMPAGDVVVAEKKNEPTVSKQINDNLQKNLPGAIKQPEPELKRIPMPAGEVTALNRKKPTTELKKPAATPAKAITLLPPMYSDRKINLVRTITVNTDSIFLKVYDNGEIDGDIITVTFNDKIVIDHLTLTSRSHTISLPINKDGNNTIIMNANNLGEIPPNTARLEIIYGNNKEALDVSSDFKVSSALNIMYKK